MKIKNSYKRMFALLMSLVLMLTTMLALDLNIASAATSGTCGDKATWSYDSTTTTLTISGTGATKDYNASSSKAPWQNYKSAITNLVVEEGITEIGNYNFYNCTALTSVSLPSTLTSLDGTGTMTTSYGCFQGCTALTSITLPSNLKTIENCVFKDCTALKSITLPDSLTTLSYGAFAKCSSLAEVTFGNGLTSTGSNAFYDCSGLKRINWGDNITAISEYSFFNCGLKEIDIPEAITEIGYRALANCSFLDSVTVNNANLTFSGDPCNGSEQSITIYGHKGSTAETYATSYSYTFVSIDPCDHEVTYEKVAKEPTCTETGTTQKICQSCGQVVSESTTAKLGHTYEVTESVDNTSIDGHIYTTQVCSRCKDETSTVEHQKAADDSSTRYVWVEGYYTYANTATCTVPGVATYTCTVDNCGTTVGSRFIATTEVLNVTTGNHNVEEWTVTPATCTVEGSKTGTCTVCNEEITETIAATGHTYTDDDFSEEISEEESGDGHSYKFYICESCGEDVAVPTHIEWVDGCYTANVISAARCVIDGLEVDTCDICSITRNVTLPANGSHDWYETSTTEPTCTATGKTYYACQNCTMTKTESIDALGHNYVDDDTNSTEPTCTETGTKAARCTRCNYLNSTALPALGHTVDEDNYTINSEATCENSGSLTSVCTVCGTEFTKTIDALGHDYQNVVVDLTSQGKPGHSQVTPTCTRCGSTQSASTSHDEWIDNYYTTRSLTDPTCSVRGTYLMTCSICNTTSVGYIPALGHNYSYTGTQACNGLQYKCSICNTTSVADYDDVISYWDASFANSKTFNRTGTDNSTYLDVNGDGIINGKDYAMIMRAKNNAPEHKYTSTIVNPTCTEQGYTHYECSECGGSYDTDYTEIDSTAHSFDDSEQYCLNGCGTENTNYVPTTESTEE